MTVVDRSSKTYLTTKTSEGIAVPRPIDAPSLILKQAIDSLPKDVSSRSYLVSKVALQVLSGGLWAASVGLGVGVILGGGASPAICLAGFVGAVATAAVAAGLWSKAGSLVDFENPKIRAEYHDDLLSQPFAAFTSKERMKLISSHKLLTSDEILYKFQEEIDAENILNVAKVYKEVRRDCSPSITLPRFAEFIQRAAPSLKIVFEHKPIDAFLENETLDFVRSQGLISDTQILQKLQSFFKTAPVSVSEKMYLKAHRQLSAPFTLPPIDTFFKHAIPELVERVKNTPFEQLSTEFGFTFIAKWRLLEGADIFAKGQSMLEDFPRRSLSELKEAYSTVKNSCNEHFSLPSVDRLIESKAVYLREVVSRLDIKTIRRMCGFELAGQFSLLTQAQVNEKLVQFFSEKGFKVGFKEFLAMEESELGPYSLPASRAFWGSFQQYLQNITLEQFFEDQSISKLVKKQLLSDEMVSDLRNLKHELAELKSSFSSRKKTEKRFHTTILGEIASERYTAIDKFYRIEQREKADIKSWFDQEKRIRFEPYRLEMERAITGANGTFNTEYALEFGRVSSNELEGNQVNVYNQLIDVRDRAIRTAKSTYKSHTQAISVDVDKRLHVRLREHEMQSAERRNLFEKENRSKYSQESRRHTLALERMEHEYKMRLRDLESRFSLIKRPR